MSKKSPAGTPAATHPSSAVDAELVAPKQIGWAVKLLWIAAALQLVATVLSVINISTDGFRDRVREALITQSQGDLGEALVDVAIKFSIVTAIALGIIWILVYFALSTFIGRGALWARLVAGIVVIGSIYQITGLTMPGGIFTIAQIFAGLAAVVLCYIKPASTYFRETQIQRLRQKRR